MLKNSKILVLNEKIRECGKDSKQLYKLVIELTGGTKENPFPDNTDGDCLANDFVEFFSTLECIIMYILFSIQLFITRCRIN